jgi:anti-sigma regulatory factor (Ser/Thr protein kinase)
MGSAIAHGGKKGHPVEVVVTLEGAALTLEVRDRGRAVPAARAAERDIPPSTMKTVSFVSDRGVNTLTLSKKVRVL